MVFAECKKEDKTLRGFMFSAALDLQDNFLLQETATGHMQTALNGLSWLLSTKNGRQQQQQQTHSLLPPYLLCIVPARQKGLQGSTSEGCEICRRQILDKQIDFSLGIQSPNLRMVSMEPKYLGFLEVIKNTPTAHHLTFGEPGFVGFCI